MGLFVLIRCIFVRLLFACHGIISIWRLYLVSRDGRAWYISLALIGLIAETIFTIWKKKGQEWKWFCPSVFFFLLCTVPAVWFLEIHELEKRIRLRQTFNMTGFLAFNDTEEDLSGRIEGLGLEIHIPLKLTSDQWLRTLEQALLLFLIVGRWILPKGKLTHDQLSQLLLVYIGTAADIVEFFDAFKEEKVRYNRILCYSILGIWAWSLLQFTMVLTATKARKDQSGVLPKHLPSNAEEKDEGCCTPDVYGIIISIMMQDAPFLILRLLLILHYGVLSYTNMFFTCKNSLVIALLIYRLIVVQMERRRDAKKNGGGALKGGDYITMSDSNSKSRLLSSGGFLTSPDPTFDRCVKQDVVLREPAEDPDEPAVPYTIRRHLSFEDFTKDTLARRQQPHCMDANHLQPRNSNADRH